jgi:hypothetical protein
MRTFPVRLAAMAMVLWGFEQVAFACPTCGAEDDAMAIAPESVARALDVVAASDVSIGSDARGNGPTALERLDTRVAAALGFAVNDTLSFALDVPWIWRTAWASGAPPTRVRGLGDAEIRGRWTARRDTDSVTLALGALLPTAPLVRAVDGAALDWRVQLGTGALEPVASATYHASGVRWAASASLTVLWPTAGWLGVQPGRSLRGTLAAQESLGRRVRLRVAVDLRWDEAWRVQSALDPDTGGFVAYVAPEVRILLDSRWGVALSARTPFLEALRGSQLHGTLYRAGLVFEP